ncbi:MAG: PEP-utilizing enzyme, partial [Acidimicrobiia bacterium]
VLADPEDAFLLTVDELTGPLPPDPQQLVKERRALREHYQGLELVTPCWTGTAEARPVVVAERVDSLTGVAASPGLVEGRARVVTEPAEADMEPGEILVAHTTDPGWASLMFLAKALVVDIGGLLSHAAVVARELGIPCVMNTGVGTQVLASGDLVRVDGDAGTVEVLERS